MAVVVQRVLRQRRAQKVALGQLLLVALLLLGQEVLLHQLVLPPP